MLTTHSFLSLRHDASYPHIYRCWMNDSGCLLLGYYYYSATHYSYITIYPRTKVIEYTSAPHTINLEIPSIFLSLLFSRPFYSLWIQEINNHLPEYRFIYSENPSIITLHNRQNPYL